MLAGLAARCVFGVNAHRATVGADRHYNPAVETELSINRRDEAGGVVIALSGELDVVSAPELEQCLNDVLAEPQARVTLDLSELAFVDSAGMSVLIKAKQDAESNGRTLVLGRAT